MEPTDTEKLDQVNRQIETLAANLAELDIALARTNGYVRRLVNTLNTLDLPEVDEGEGQ